MKIAALDRAHALHCQGREGRVHASSKINDLVYALGEGMERPRVEKVTARRNRRQQTALLDYSHELTYLLLISFRPCQPKDEHARIDQLFRFRNSRKINSRRVDFRSGL